MSDVMVELPHFFEARDYQWPLLIALEEDQKKRAYIVWHRRSGKDKTLWNYLINRAFDVIGQHYYLFPTYAQAKKVIWEGIDNTGLKFLSHIPSEILDGKPNDTEMKVTLTNGSIIQLIGTDNYDAIRGTNPQTCIFSEYAYQDPRAWGVLRPILKVNGGVAVFNTTPNGENHAFDLWKLAKESDEWFTECLTVNDTGILTLADIEKERAEGMSEEMIQQEYYCSWSSALVGSFYGQRLRDMEDQGRIGLVPWDEHEQVMTFWDLGMNDETAIWFVQQSGFAFKVLDCYANHGQGFEHYAKVLQDKPYRYSKHYLPHDGRNRELSNGLERSKTLDSLLREEVVVMKRPKVIQDKIEAVRWVLPKVYIDADKCRDGINAMKNYRQEYDERLKTWKKEPLHDWSSHYADAFAGFALEAKNGTFASQSSGAIMSNNDSSGSMELVV